jgi:hypothetical protein
MREIVDLAEMVHTHLDHRITMLRTQLEQRERHADVIVEIALRRKNGLIAPRSSTQNGRQHLFDGGLAVTARDGDQRDVELRTPMRGELAQSDTGISHN